MLTILFLIKKKFLSLKLGVYMFSVSASYYSYDFGIAIVKNQKGQFLIILVLWFHSYVIIRIWLLFEYKNRQSDPTL